MAVKYDDPFSELPADTPVYRLLMAHFMEDDTLHPEDEVVAFTGPPSEYMEPLNEPAREAMRKQMELLDAHARVAAEKANRPFNGRPKDFADQLAQSLNDARSTDGQNQKLQVIMPEKLDIPLRPDLATPAQKAARKRVLTPRLLASKATPPPGKPTPRPIHVHGKNYDDDAASSSNLS